MPASSYNANVIAEFGDVLTVCKGQTQQNWGRKVTGLTGNRPYDSGIAGRERAASAAEAADTPARGKDA